MSDCQDGTVQLQIFGEWYRDPVPLADVKFLDAEGKRIPGVPAQTYYPGDQSLPSREYDAFGDPV